MGTAKEQKSAFIKYLASLVIYSFNGIVASRVSMHSYEIVVLRYAIGILILLAIFLVLGGKFTFTHHWRDVRILALAGIGTGVGQLFLFESLKHIGVGISTLIYYSGPVIVMLTAPLMFREKLSWIKMAGLAVVIGGVALINGDLTQQGGSAFGVLCAVIAACSFFFMVSVNKKAENIIGIEKTIVHQTFCVITAAAVLVWNQGFHMEIPKGEWHWLLLLGLISGLGAFLYFGFNKFIPAQTLAVCGYLEPLGAVVFSMILLRERFTLLQLLGGIMIIGGAVFAETYRPKRAKNHGTALHV